MNKTLFLAVFISFLTTLYILPSWIRRAKNAGLEGLDINKYENKKVSEAGGIIAILGFILGVLVYIAIQVFYFDSINNLIEVFALIGTILILAGIGLIDDILGWKIGLGKWPRLLLVLFAAVPLMVINAGHHEIFLPFLGSTNIGIIYAIPLIPLGIIGTSVTFNFIAGYNGLEAGQGILILSALSIMSFLTGSSWLGLVGLCMVGALIAFLYFNRYPAKVFPGDVLTYPVGGLIGIMAILGNYELFAVFVFSPYILETILKLRGGLKKESFGDPQKDGSIKNKYDKIYGIEHLAIRIIEKIKPSKKAYESEVVILINFFQILLIVIGFLIFGIKYV